MRLTNSTVKLGCRMKDFYLKLFKKYKRLFKALPVSV
jgi:hypothetical protein